MIAYDEFNMWRALVAFSVCDNKLSLEEQRVLYNHMVDVNFSTAQKEILKRDLKTPQDIEKLFKKIKNPVNKRRFCELARTLAWCEGNVTRQEKEILKRVSCLKNIDGNPYLESTRNTDFILDFAKRYEDIAFMNDNKPFSLFDISA